MVVSISENIGVGPEENNTAWIRTELGFLFMPGPKTWDEHCPLPHKNNLFTKIWVCIKKRFGWLLMLGRGGGLIFFVSILAMKSGSKCKARPPRESVCWLEFITHSRQCELFYLHPTFSTETSCECYLPLPDKRSTSLFACCWRVVH